MVLLYNSLPNLYNKTISVNNSSSFSQGIILFSPTTLKQKLLKISTLYYYSKFDVENFRINYPDEFWNAIWYFELQGIDITFMLPYLKPNKIQILASYNKMKNFIKFVSQDSHNSEVVQGNIFKNPNNKVENIKTKNIEFNKDILFIQHVYQLSILNIIGMIMYKSPD